MDAQCPSRLVLDQRDRPLGGLRQGLGQHLLRNPPISRWILQTHAFRQQLDDYAVHLSAIDRGRDETDIVRPSEAGDDFDMAPV